MRNFVVVGTLRRGSLEKPEPLDEAGQYVANMRADLEDEMVRGVLQRRATRRYQLERDPVPDAEEVSRLMSKHGNSRAARMLELAEKVRIA